MKFLHKSFIFPWLIVLGLFFLGPIQFGEIEFSTYLLIVLFLLAGFLGLTFGKVTKISIKQNEIAPSRNLYRILIGLSSLYFFVSILKLQNLSELVQFNFNLEGVTNLRYQKKTLDLEKGAFVSGIISRILSGIPVITFLYKEHFLSAMNKRQKIIGNIIGAGALVFSLTDGGRNSLVILCSLFFLSRFRLFHSKYKKKYKSILTKENLLILGSMILIVLAIFILRGERNDDSLSNNLRNFEKEYSISINEDLKELVTNQNTASKATFAFINLNYYLTHSIHELDVLTNSEEMKLTPYMGAYQFYNFTLFFNKLGAKFISIEEILSDIPNPGTYFTAIGALYIDFGLTGALIAFFIICYLMILFYRRFQLNKNLSDFLNFSLVYLFVLFSPIFSIIGIGVFSSIITSVLIFNFLNLKYGRN